MCGATGNYRRHESPFLVIDDGYGNVLISVEHAIAMAIWGTSIHAAHIGRNVRSGLAQDPKDRENPSSQIAWLAMCFAYLQKAHVDVAGSSHVLRREGS